MRTDTDEVGGIHKDSRDRLRRRRPEGQHPLGEHAVEMRLQCDPAGSVRVEIMVERASRCITGPVTSCSFMPCQAGRFYWRLLEQLSTIKAACMPLSSSGRSRPSLPVIAA